MPVRAANELTARLDPHCSNRSAALLKLNKVTKAMEDAEKCIALNPDWEKGYFRKAAILELLDKMPEASTPADVSNHISNPQKC